MPDLGSVLLNPCVYVGEIPRGMESATCVLMRKTGPLLLLLALTACDVLGPKVINDKFVCSGSDAGMGSFRLDLTEGQAAQFGEAFAASGNCDATIEKSIFTSPGLALRAGGNTRLIFIGGRIEGNPAVDASGNASIEFRGTEVKGEIKISGNAKVTGLEDVEPAS